MIEHNPGNKELSQMLLAHCTMMLPTRKIGAAKKLTSTRILIGSEDPVQVFNKFGIQDGLDDMDLQ